MWTNDELAKIGKAEELDIESRRLDGTLRNPVTIWVVRHGDDLYVRAVKGRTGPWFRGTQERHEGRILAGGVEREVAFVQILDPELNRRIEVLPGIRALRDVSVDDFNRHSGRLEPLVARRARHVVEECARTQSAVAVLRAGRVADFGALMNDCHASLRDLYEVSIPELNTMVAAAQALPGCYGARLTGAGFGGCTVNLVASEAAPGFTRDLAAAYQRTTGREAEIYVCEAADGAGVIAEGI